MSESSTIIMTRQETSDQSMLDPFKKHDHADILIDQVRQKAMRTIEFSDIQVSSNQYRLSNYALGSLLQLERQP